MMDGFELLETSAPPRPRPAGSDPGFQFGLEVEYLLVDADSFRPLWLRELSFPDLAHALGSVPTADIPGLEGLSVKPPHRRRMPFYVEGYHVPDPDSPEAELWPKGLEVRTPPMGTPEAAVSMLGTLLDRLGPALRPLGLRMVAVAHHPLETWFEGPRGSRAHDRWQWAQRAMLTHGPDMNVSLPEPLSRHLEGPDLGAKVNAYAPALTVLSLASPLFAGEPWRTRGRVGKSIRTHHRSVFGQAMKRHPSPAGRYEFKSFDMTHRLGELHAYLLLWLAVLLDDGLLDRATETERIYDLGAIARDGLDVPHVRHRTAEVLERAPAVLAAHGFNARPLATVAARLASHRLPADEILENFDREGSLEGALRHLVPETRLAARPAKVLSPLAS